MVRQADTINSRNVTKAGKTIKVVKVDRSVTVSDYEVVVLQGVKNIRNLHKETLVKRLEEVRNKEIARVTWSNGGQTNRQGLIDALKAAKRLQPTRVFCSHD